MQWYSKCACTGGKKKTIYKNKYYHTICTINQLFLKLSCCFFFFNFHSFVAVWMSLFSFVQPVWMFIFPLKAGLHCQDGSCLTSDGSSKAAACRWLLCQRNRWLLRLFPPCWQRWGFLSLWQWNMGSSLLSLGLSPAAGRCILRFPLSEGAARCPCQRLSLCCSTFPFVDSRWRCRTHPSAGAARLGPSEHRRALRPPTPEQQVHIWRRCRRCPRCCGTAAGGRPASEGGAHWAVSCLLWTPDWERRDWGGWRKSAQNSSCRRGSAAWPSGVRRSEAMKMRKTRTARSSLSRWR